MIPHFLKVLHLINQSVLHHFIHAQFDFLIKLFPFIVKYKIPELIWRLPVLLRFVVLGNRIMILLIKFQSTDYSFIIMKVNLLCRNRIHLFKQIMKIFFSLFSKKLFIFLTDPVILFFLKQDVIDQRLDIKSGSTNHNWNMPVCINLCHSLLCHLLKYINIKFFLRIQAVNQVMWNAAHLFLPDLRRTDVHITVHLHRICRNNLALYLSGKGNGKRGLPDCCRSCQNKQGWFLLHSFTYVTILLNFFSISYLLMEIIVGLPCGQ